MAINLNLAPDSPAFQALAQDRLVRQGLTPEGYQPAGTSPTRTNGPMKMWLYLGGGIVGGVLLGYLITKKKKR